MVLSALGGTIPAPSRVTRRLKFLVRFHPRWCCPTNDLIDIICDDEAFRRLYTQAAAPAHQPLAHAH